MRIGWREFLGLLVCYAAFYASQGHEMAFEITHTKPKPPRRDRLHDVCYGDGDHPRDRLLQ